MFAWDEPVVAAPSNRCYRCGGLLGMSRTMMYRVEPDQGDESAADSADRLGLGLWPALHHGFPKNLLGRLKWVVKGGPFTAFQMRRQIKDIETFCQRCGQHSREEGARSGMATRMPWRGRYVD